MEVNIGLLLFFSMVLGPDQGSSVPLYNGTRSSRTHHDPTPPWGHANWLEPDWCQEGQIIPDIFLGHDLHVTSEELPQCGLSEHKNADLHAMSRRVVGGKESARGEWPWLVALGRKYVGQECGGTLVSPHWVITAAHCFQKEIDGSINVCEYNVRLGEHNLFDDEESHVDITPDLIITHPQYDPGLERNDIALVHLSRPAPIEDNQDINVVCLPQPDDDFRKAECMVAGWGRYSVSHFKTSYTVRHVSAPILSRTTCLKVYGLLPRGQFCAGHTSGGRDSCKGDSGGPLVCRRPDDRGQYVLVGVVSWGEGCAVPGKTGVYSSTQYYMDWIMAMVQQYTQS